MFKLNKLTLGKKQNNTAVLLKIAKKPDRMVLRN